MNSGFRVTGFGFRVPGFRFQGLGFKFRVSGFGRTEHQWRWISRRVYSGAAASFDQPSFDQPSFDQFEAPGVLRPTNSASW